MIFEGHLLISVYVVIPTSTETANTKSHDSSRVSIRLSMTLPMFQGRRLFDIKFLVNGAGYGKSYY